jgi:hypothetical protein
MFFSCCGRAQWMKRKDREEVIFAFSAMFAIQFQYQIAQAP